MALLSSRRHGARHAPMQKPGAMNAGRNSHLGFSPVAHFRDSANSQHPKCCQDSCGDTSPASLISESRQYDPDSIFEGDGDYAQSWLGSWYRICAANDHLCHPRLELMQRKLLRLRPIPLIANPFFDGFGVRLKGLLGLSTLRAQNRTDIREVLQSYFPRENVTNPSRFGILTFGSVLASIVSFSPTTPLSCKIYATTA